MRRNKPAHFSTQTNPVLAHVRNIAKPEMQRLYSGMPLAGLVLISMALTSPMINADPSVDGAVISWPDDGWYQVQTSDGASTLCNGGSSCTVEPGHYLVINHTTGERFDNMAVGGHVLSPEITVEGQRISWPDDGWYQVQTADGNTSLCSGADYCDVNPGTYLVINHTTGVRVSGIEILTEQPLPESPGVINRENHADLLTQIFSVYTGTIYGDTLPAIPTKFMESRTSTSVDMTDDMTDDILNGQAYDELERYACDNGGVLDYLTSHGDGDFFQIPVWDNCLDGTIVKDGTLSFSTNSVDSTYRGLIFATYTADYPNGEQVAVSGKFGSMDEPNIDPASLRSERWINDELNYLLHNESTPLHIRNISTDTSYDWFDRDGDVFTASLEGSFQLSSSLTDHHAVQVMTNEALSVRNTLAGGFDFIERQADALYPAFPDWNFESGELAVTADDGSALHLDADMGGSGAAEITLLQDGVVVETFMQPWSLWRNALTTMQEDTRHVR